MSNIVLIGFMGCGKTTLAKYISANEGFAFCDTDDLIEKKEGMTINEIFAKKGEAYFRQLETDTIRDMLGHTHNTVVSVGGGLPVKEENRKLLRELGVCVYMRTSRDELVRRLANDTSRPLLAGGELEKKIDGLMAARKSIYEAVADVVIDTEHMSKEEIFAMIAERI